VTGPVIDEDHPTVFGSSQEGQGGLHAQECAFGIGCHHPIPVGLGQVFQCRIGENASIAAEHVEAAIHLLQGAYQRLDGGGVSHIGGQPLYLQPIGAHTGSDGFDLVSVARGDQYTRALDSKLPGNSKAYATAGTSDQDTLAT
jgi:hypothetical protein